MWQVHLQVFLCLLELHVEVPYGVIIRKSESWLGSNPIPASHYCPLWEASGLPATHAGRWLMLLAPDFGLVVWGVNQWIGDLRLSAFQIHKINK